MNGYGERCGNANLVTILADLQLKLGYRVRAARAARAPDRDRAPRRRALQRHPEPQPALRGRQRVRAQGRHARGRRQPRRAHLRARRPRRGGGRPARADLRAVGQGHGAGARRARPALDARRRGRRAGGRAGEGPRAPRVPPRGRRRLVRPAHPPRDRRLRAALPARVLAGDRREARAGQRRDRGDDQDLGRRRALRAHGRGQRPGERARHGAARRRSARPTRTCATSSS